MKRKHPYAQAHRIATQLVDKLRPACERIEIAGSLRRKQAEVGDIEIVAIGRPILDLLGEPFKTTEIEYLLQQWVDDRHIEMRKDGFKYKQFDFCASEGTPYTVDLFLVQPETWGVQLLIRTGPAAFSKRMVTSKSSGGWRPDYLFVRDGRVWGRSSNDLPLNTPEERDVFDLWQMDYIEPEERRG